MGVLASVFGGLGRAKKPVLWLLAALALLPISSYSCGQIVRPLMVESINVDLREVNAANVTAEIAVTVNNPNPFEGEIKEITFDIYYLEGDEWCYMGHGEMLEEAALKASGSTYILIPAEVGSTEIGRAMVQMLATGKSGVRVSGSMQVGLSPISFEMPLNITTTVSLR